MAPTAARPSAAIICRAAPSRADLRTLASSWAMCCSARRVAWRIDSAAMPPRGATRAASAVRSASTGMPKSASAAGGMHLRIQGRARGRAARLIAADVRPVAQVLDAQEFLHLDPGARQRLPDGVRDRRDERLGAVSDGHRRVQPLRADDGRGVRGEVGGGAEAGRVGQVVPERDPDAVPGRRGPDHHDAGLRDEAEQVRDDREERRGRVHPDDPVHVGGLRGLRVVITRSTGLSHTASVGCAGPGGP